MRRILVHNIPGRWWLWRHRNHRYHNLGSDPWICSCGSIFKGIVTNSYERQAGR